MKVHVKVTNTISFIKKEKVPQNIFREVAYSRIVCDVREGKSEKNRTRLTVGGEKIKYPVNCGTPTANLFTSKLLLNSVISTVGENLMTLDIKKIPEHTDGAI